MAENSDSETNVKQREGDRKDTYADSYDNASGRNEEAMMDEEQGQVDVRETTRLIIKDLPIDAHSQFIQLFFEKKMFGGFDVLNVEFDEEQSMALVEFSDPEAVVKVLQQRPIAMIKTEIRVKPYFEVEEEEEPLCTILVCGLFKVDEETIVMYFEDEKRAGGDIIENLNLIKEGKAFITYKSEAVARRVVDKGNHALNRQLLEVTLWQPLPKQTWNIRTPEPEPELGPADTIEVRGIGDSLVKETIEKYFENTKRSGGGEIRDMKVEEDVAFITYFSEEVAQRVIDKGNHVLNKRELQVLIWREMMTITTTPDRELSPEPVSTVEVYGVDRSLDEETLAMYFENTKRSGGGDIDDITVNYGDGVAYITYHEVMVAQRVVNKGEHTLNKTELTVQIHIKPTKAQKPMPVKRSKTSKFQKSTDSNKTDEEEEEPAPTSVVKVKGIKRVTSLETMRYYFENTRRSGGGDIQDLMHHEEDDDIVFITFSVPEVAKEVASREHSVEEKTLQVSLHVPPKPRPFYEDKVLIRGLKCTTTKDCLFNFLEAKSGAVPIDLQRGEKEGVALITFESEADYVKLTTVCGKTPLEGSTLQVSKVQVTNCIIVINIPEKTSKDTVTFYFENTRRSNGGPIDKVVMKEEDCSCLVYFMDYKVVDRVIAQKHVISDYDVIVKMFLECLGCPQGDISEMPFKLPDAVIISDLHQKIIKFMKISDANKTAMAMQMEAVNASVSWPKKETKSNDVVIECTLTKQMKEARMIAKSWKQVAKKNFDDFMKNIVIELLMVSQEHWNNFMVKIKSVQITNPDGVAVLADRDQCSVAVVGMKQIVEGVVKDIATMVKQLEEEAEKENEKTKELITTLKLIETKMLLAEKYPNKMEIKYGGLRVKINQNKNEIVFEGLTGDIKAAKCDMFEMKDKYATVSVDLKGSKSCCLLYDSKMAKDYIVKKLKTNHVTAVWEVRDQKLIVCSTCENTIDKSLELVKGSIVEQSISLTKENVDVVHSDSWLAVLVEQNQKYPGKTAAEVQGNVAYVCGTDDIVSDVLGVVKKFLKTNTIVEDHVDFGKHINRLIEKDHKDEIASISKKCANLNTQVVPKASNTGFTLRGTSEGVEHAKNDLQNLNSKVKKSLQSPGIRDHMARKGQDHMQTIEQRFPVVFGASEDEDDFYDEIPARMDEGPIIHAVCSAYDDRKIYTAEGDMTELSVDVLVHAADSKLSLTGGLGKAMLAKGGSVIQEACKDYIRDEGELGEGEAFVSSAGKLRAKYIVHVVGPVWNDGTHNEESLLAESVLKSMRQASVKNVKSIAIPAISCGVYSFPLKRATRVIVESVKNFFREMQETTIMEVYLCDVKSKTVEGFMDALGSAFGAHNLKKLLPTQRPSTRPIPKPRPKEAYYYMSDAQPGPDKPAFNTMQPGQNNGVLIGNITVTVVKGEIAKQDVDVIVNTTARNLDLKTGAVSASLLRAAGSRLQDEVTNAYPNGIKDGEIAVTSGQNLRCQSIIHTSLMNWDGKNNKAKKALHTLMNNCLNEADDNKFQSIAFPAIGTGNLGFPRDVVAREMFSVISSFTSDNPHTSIRDVRFIVYQKDFGTISAFDAEEKSRMSGAGSARNRQSRQIDQPYANFRELQPPDSDPTQGSAASDKKSQKPAANVRDLMHSAIERNLSRYQISAPDRPRSTDAVFRSAGQPMSQMMPHDLRATDLIKDPMSANYPEHRGSPYPKTARGDPRDIRPNPTGGMDLFMRPSDGMDKSSHGFKGDLKDFGPRHGDAHKSSVEKAQRKTMNTMTPPPAHSNRRSTFQVQQENVALKGKPDPMDKSQNLYQERNLSPSIRSQMNVIVVGHDQEMKCVVANALIRQKKRFIPFMTDEMLSGSTKRFKFQKEPARIIVTSSLATPAWNSQLKILNQDKQYENKCFVYVKDMTALRVNHMASIKKIENQSGKPVVVVITFPPHKTQSAEDELKEFVSKWPTVLLNQEYTGLQMKPFSVKVFDCIAVLKPPTDEHLYTETEQGHPDDEIIEKSGEVRMHNRIPEVTQTGNDEDDVKLTINH